MTNQSEQKITEFDWHDSDALFKFGVGTINVAHQYQLARKTFALSLKSLKLGLVEMYGKGNIPKTFAEEKAYLIMADQDIFMREALSNKIEAEHEYKGLEKVLETRQALTSLAQSLIKNRIENQ